MAARLLRHGDLGPRGGVPFELRSCSEVAAACVRAGPRYLGAHAFRGHREARNADRLDAAEEGRSIGLLRCVGTRLATRSHTRYGVCLSRTVGAAGSQPAGGDGGLSARPRIESA